MDLTIKKARERIKSKCEENENYSINKLEAYILTCDTPQEVIILYAYDILEDKIKKGEIKKEDLRNIYEDVFGEKNKISSVVQNFIIKDEVYGEELHEYKDLVEPLKKECNKKC